MMKENSEGETMRNLKRILGAVAVTSAIVMAASADAQEVKHYRFAYDQPKTTGYGILGDIFSDKLKELSKGTMLIDQYPGAQLGQEPQVLQLVKAGDVEFCISSSANAATLSPQAGVMSMHFLFRSEAHLIKAMADPGVSNAVKAMIAETVQGARVIALATLGLRNMYSKREIKKVDDVKGLKVRVHHVPGLWRADRAHAVRQRLHIAADRCGRRRRKRRQRLSRQQALRSSAGAFDDRTRGQ
jgi:TRAP-type C4-dicarboxylate transport system substrate-binding protein